MVRLVREGGVQKLRARRAEKLERVQRRQLGPSLRILTGRGVRRQRVEAVSGHPLRVEFTLARGRREMPVGEWGVLDGKIKPERPFLLESLKRDPMAGGTDI